MKKRLEADLISIAHNILQLKNKSDINQLFLVTQKLYEKLAVLRFVEDHFGEVTPTIGIFEVEKTVEQVFDNMEALKNTAVTEPILAQETIENNKSIASFVKEEEVLLVNEENKIVAQESIVLASDTIVEKDIEVIPVKEEIKIIKEEKIAIKDIEVVAVEDGIIAFKDEVVEIKQDIQEKKVVSKPVPVQISFEDFLGSNFDESMFVKAPEPEYKFAAFEAPLDTKDKPESKTSEVPKIMSLNDSLSKGIYIDLNDRIAFVQNLFGNSLEEYNRVLNQLITYDNFDEAMDFINQMVKPDYDDWKGKEDYARRFVEILKKKYLV
jgi:hypothetical protein